MARSGRVAVALAVLLALAGATPAVGGSTPGAGGTDAGVSVAVSGADPPQDGTTTGANESNDTVVLDGIDPDYDAEATLARVEELRGLSATGPVVVHEYDDEDGPEVDLRDQFGAIRPAGARALQLYSNASAERRLPLGYTVERDDGVHVYLMNATDVERYGVSQEVVLAHEFVHALQFQHDLLSPSREAFRTQFDDWTTDTRLVTTALVEGDAMWTTEGYVERYADGEYAAADYNRTLAREAWPHSVGGTPYYYGYEYYHEAGSSPEARTAAIRNPPDSTAELLHPDETIERPPIPSPPESSQEFEALTRHHEDTVGELVVRHALRINGLSFAEAARAADGWSNDRMYYYTEEATTATHWVTAWENETEAQEFADAWREVLDARNATDGENGTLVVPETDDAPAVYYVVEREGSLVRVTAAPNADLAERLSEAAR
ncbi:hypothetical protein NGM10_11025 [Halorussus salilacus]|uniref:hypothetical protein n=1 Tax=Halorussus salilacus TaxID=2953750 RepID=UPI00209C7728|nr:hypothetical protein [Halorussus salilacus]USZ67262.1 hypothetical protein NGM10_11025 [Halorussus salilacus]